MECRNLLSNVTLQANVTAIWQWHPDIAGGLHDAYKLSVAYHSRGYSLGRFRKHDLASTGAVEGLHLSLASASR